MDRRSQIFAPTKSVGGVRKPAKKQGAAPEKPNLAFKSVIDSLKGNLKPTILTNFSYKTGDQIVSVPDAKIRSVGNNGKHVAFLVTGKSILTNEKQAMSELSEAGKTE